MTKQEFIDYVKFFPSMTLEEELENIYANHNEINDISGVEHSLDDINNYSKEIRFYQCNDKSVLTSAEMPDVDFFIFVVIGSIKEGFVGTCYCMTHAILEDIRSGKTNVEREVVNLCISKEQLSRMKVLV